MTTPLRSEFLVVAEQLLRSQRRPLSARELVEAGVREALFSDKVAGKTPHQTMKAKLSVHIRRHRERSIFVRTAPGRFFLRELLRAPEGEYRAHPLARPPEVQKVLVFPARILDGLGRFQGIRRSAARVLPRLLRSPSCRYVSRLKAEQDDELKQVVTYIMVTRGRSLLAFRRGTYNRVEDYLKGSYCVGFGGHVTAGDLTLFDSGDRGLFQSAIRELHEELELPAADRARLARREGLNLLGVLNDDSSPVGRRHIAAIFQYEVSHDDAWNRPARGEKSITQLRWLPLGGDLPIWGFEYWSQLCLRSYFPESVRPSAAFTVRRRSRFTPAAILVVTGQVGSGKTETTTVLRRDFGYAEVDSGKVLAAALGLEPIPRTPRHAFQQRAWEFISKVGGPSRLAELIAEQLPPPGRRVLVNGIRHPTTLRALRDRLRPRRLAVVYVHTPADVAFDFLRRREGLLSVTDFVAVREATVEKEVETLLRDSDAILYNWTGRRKYKGIVHRFMRAVGISQE